MLSAERDFCPVKLGPKTYSERFVEIRTHLSGFDPILESPDLSFRGLNAPGDVKDLISPPPGVGPP